MTQTDRVPTNALQEAGKGHEGEAHDGACPMRTRPVASFVFVIAFSF